MADRRPNRRRFVTAELGPGVGYKLMSGLVVPRPIGWIGTRGTDGRNNLAPYSFFNGVSSSPPIVIFSPVQQPSGRKDSLANARETGVFTVNIVDHAHVEPMNASAATVAAEVDEFELVGLEVEESDLIDAPKVASAPATMECEVVKLVDLTDVGSDAVTVFGRVLAIDVDERILVGEHRVDQAGLDAVGRHVGSTYSRTRELFDIDRPG
ncbi:MAG: flavin reductase family protein [Actinomycetota bacterium]